ncbi:unnamed protein product [Prunus armeniaca]
MQLPSFNIFGWGQTISLLLMFTQLPAQSTEPGKDVRSLMNIDHVRAEIELLVDFIFYKQKIEVSQTHNKEFHGYCSRSKGCNLPSQYVRRTSGPSPTSPTHLPLTSNMSVLYT